MFGFRRRKLLGLFGFSLTCTVLFLEFILNNMKVKPVVLPSDAYASQRGESEKIPNVTRFAGSSTNAVTEQREDRLASNVASVFEQKSTIYEDHRLPTDAEVTVRPVNYTGAIFVTVSRDGAGRLGNRMFQYAALIGLTKEAAKTQPRIFPVVQKHSHMSMLFDVFHLGGAKNLPVENPVMLSEDQPLTYCPRILKELLPGYNYTAMTYLQSWKYFSNYSRTIRNEFRFKDAILEEAKAFLRKAVNDSSEHVTLVGVHVRRGDMTLSYYEDRGYTPANATYLHNALKYYREKYVNVLFVVCSDDFDWAQKHINGKDVRFTADSKAEVDLAILTLCNHSIITSGSFGWWGAWLAGGHVVYYRKFPGPGSWLDSTCTRADYYPESWVALE